VLSWDGERVWQPALAVRVVAEVVVVAVAAEVVAAVAAQYYSEAVLAVVDNTWYWEVHTCFHRRTRDSNFPLDLADVAGIAAVVREHKDCTQHTGSFELVEGCILHHVVVAVVVAAGVAVVRIAVAAAVVVGHSAAMSFATMSEPLVAKRPWDVAHCCSLHVAAVAAAVAAVVVVVVAGEDLLLVLRTLVDSVVVPFWYSITLMNTIREVQ
jgi:hypothetical protein